MMAKLFAWDEAKSKNISLGTAIDKNGHSGLSVITKLCTWDKA